MTIQVRTNKAFHGAPFALRARGSLAALGARESRR